jgi:NADH dehydrogenase (ubiquinone) Fe-S protein 3
MTKNNILKLVQRTPIVKTELYQLQYGVFTTNFLLKDFILILKNHFIFQFKILTYISGLDYPENYKRFKLIYDFLSLKYNNRLRVKILIDETLPVYSINKLFKGSNWWEAEAWDMFGIIFSRQKNVVRLLTDYGFFGHPLKKDFPLSGFLESKYNLIKEKISYNKIEFAQSYRVFRQDSPWKKKYEKFKFLFNK